MGVTAEALTVAGAPQVGVTVTGLDPGDESVISVDVSWDGGGTWHGVRGAQRVERTGSAFFRDYVPPLNMPATYRVVVHEGSAIPDPAEDTVTVFSDTAWIQDPLNPRGAVAIDAQFDTGGTAWLLSSTSSTITRLQNADVVMVEGSRYPTASVGQRQVASQVPVTIRAAAAQGELVRSLRALFDSAGQLVLRGMHQDCPLDPVAHVVAGTIVEAPKDGGRYGVHNTWDLVVDQVRPSSLRVAIPFWTYDQVAALWAGMSYDTVLAARPGDTYLDWLRSPEVP